MYVIINPYSGDEKMNEVKYHNENELVADLKAYKHLKIQNLFEWGLLIGSAGLICCAFLLVISGRDSAPFIILGNSIIITDNLLNITSHKKKRGLQSRLNSFVTKLNNNKLTFIDEYTFKIIPKKLTFYTDTSYRNPLTKIINGNYVILEPKDTYNELHIFRQYEDTLDDEQILTLEELDILDDYEKIVKDLGEYKEQIDESKQKKLLKENIATN